MIYVCCTLYMYETQNKFTLFGPFSKARTNFGTEAKLHYAVKTWPQLNCDTFRE